MTLHTVFLKSMVLFKLTTFFY